MNIIIAANAGFCFGVERAVEFVYKNLDNPIPLYTLGPIIHNPLVVEELNKKGVTIVDSPENVREGRLVIRSHGVGKNIYDRIESSNITYIDATCPYVKRIHGRVEECYKNGDNIIIVGERDHPEVIGINGWCNDKAYIVYSEDDVLKLPNMDKACVVAQTTITQEKWNVILLNLKSKIKELKSFNTICYATAQRQKEAESIAKKADAMLVIGGKNSSNTKKLYDICKSHCENTFAIETVNDIDVNAFDPNDVVGITAGASTPNRVIEEVIEKMSVLEENNKEVTQVISEESLNTTAQVVEKSGKLSEEDVKDRGTEAKEIEKAEDSTTVADIVGEVQLDSQEEIQSPTEDAPKSDADADTSKDEAAEPEEVTTMEDFEETMVTLRSGQPTEGTVLSVNEDEVIINIGYKSDGILPIDEISLEEGQALSDLYNPGDKVEIEVLKVNDGEGNVVLSQKALQRRQAWKAIEEGFETEEEFEATCTESVKGGVIARINGIRAFVPASQLSNRYVEDLSTFVGQPLRLRIIELEKGRRRVVASQRLILEEEEEVNKQKLWDSIEEGQKIKGIVKRLTNFGAFVDIGGVDGLIHISDLSWGHISSPRDVLKEEEEVEVVILSADREKERISLGYKQIFPHPWDNVEEKYPADSVAKGKVVRITSFGAFVELEPGVDGLIHISQVANRRIEKVEDELSIGQEVDVKVLDSNSETKRISLSIRELLAQDKPRPKQAKPEEKREQFEKEDMTISLGEFFPEDFN